MPTGYTVGIADGKITTFEQYAMTCARAFGALVMMRDDPFDAPIPEEIKVADYYVTNAKEKSEAYDAFIALDQDGLEALYQKESADAWTYYNKSKPPENVTFKDWLAKNREKMAADVAYAYTSLQKEQTRIINANKWLRLLRESLKP